jgi:hypothetical protein
MCARGSKFVHTHTYSSYLTDCSKSGYIVHGTDSTLWCAYKDGALDISAFVYSIFVDCWSHCSNCFLFCANLSTKDYSTKCNCDYCEFCNLWLLSNTLPCVDREYSKPNRSIVDNIGDTFLSRLVVEHFIRTTIAQQNWKSETLTIHILTHLHSTVACHEVVRVNNILWKVKKRIPRVYLKIEKGNRMRKLWKKNLLLNLFVDTRASCE